MAVLVLGNELTRGGGDGGEQGSHVAFISPPDTGCSRSWTPRPGSTAKQETSEIELFVELLKHFYIANSGQR